MKNAAVVMACVFVFLWKYWALNVDYKHELDAHLQTLKQLDIALTEAQRWQAVAGETLIAANSQKQLAEACLAREAESRADEEARKAILAPTKPRPRTVAEKQQVVDDATRSHAIDRLNRGL